MAVTARVQNFQSVEDATIVIDGLTVITGTNNSGKTAVMRAIRGCSPTPRQARLFVTVVPTSR